MKVRLLTYHFSDNYGALFQAYALREWFLRRGHDAEFINYHPRYVEEGGDFDQLLDLRKWKKNLTIGYLKLSHTYWSVFGSARQRLAFDTFRRDYLGVTGARLLDAGALGEENADLLLCGSDQIWNPSVQKGLDPVYFLEFAGASRARRISYAPSFGRAALEPAFHAEAGRLIGNLDAVSVREQSGVKIIRELTGRDAQCVPDPTILLGDFNDLLGQRAHPGQHVFCYALRSAEGIREVAVHVARTDGTPLISPVSSRQRWKPIGTAVEPGPVEWLRMLDSSATVVTNSFHGVALSIILNKPFLAVVLPGKKGALNERVRNVLEKTGLTDRALASTDTALIDRVLHREIDWRAVNERLAVLRNQGESFLERQIDAVAKVPSG